MRRLAGRLAFASVLAWAGGAAAQIPLVDSIRYQIALQGKLAAANTFGAASAFQKNILPSLSTPDSFVFKLEAFNLLDATTVPAECLGDPLGSCNGHDWVKVPVSLFTMQSSVGYRWENFGLFYTGSVTKADLAGTFSTGFNTVINNTSGGLFLYNPLFGPIGTLANTGEGLEAARFDYVIGAQADVVIANVYAGYVGSRGFFTNLSQDTVRLAVTGVVSNELKTLAYLRGGFERAPWDFLESSTARAIGMTSLYGRRIQIAPPRGVVDPASVDQAAYASAVSYGLTTAHLEQLSIAQRFDLRAAVSTSPSVGLSEAQVGVHTAGFHPKRLTPAQIKAGAKASEIYDGGDELLGGFVSGAGITVGMVGLPDQPFYGVHGGAKLALSAELRTPFFRLAVQRNNPDILAVFPFAYDAWSIVWTIGTSTAELAAFKDGG